MEHVVTHLTHFLARLLLTWIARGANPNAQPATEGTGWVMGHCVRSKVATMGLASLLTALTSLAFGLMLSDGPSVFALLGTIGVGFLFLFCLYGLVDAFWRRITFDDEGLTIDRPFRSSFRIQWADIHSVDLSETSGSLAIRQVVGSTAYVATAMDGLGTFAAYLSRHSSGTISPDARRYLPNPHRFSPQPTAATERFFMEH